MDFSLGPHWHRSGPPSCTKILGGTRTKKPKGRKATVLCNTVASCPAAWPVVGFRLGLACGASGGPNHNHHRGVPAGHRPTTTALPPPLLKGYRSRFCTSWLSDRRCPPGKCMSNVWMYSLFFLPALNIHKMCTGLGITCCLFFVCNIGKTIDKIKGKKDSCILFFFFFEV